MYGFKAIVFDGRRTAREAFDGLDRHHPAYGWIDDVAEISRNKRGSIRIHSTWAQNDSEVGAGGAYGAVTGGFLGLLFGPGGALAGAAVGGSIGAMLGASNEIAFEDPKLDEFASSLANDSSALILVGETATLGEFESAAESFGGKVIHTDLGEKDIQAIQNAMDLREKA